MSSSFKLRHVNEITGAFVLLSCLAGVVGLFLASRSQNWFEPVRSYSVNLPQEGSYGLEAGAEVQVLGIVVGAVDRVKVDDLYRMQAEIHIQEDFSKLVRADSRATIKRKLGVAGDAFVEISRGSVDREVLPDGAVLPGSLDREILTMVQDMVQELRGAVVPAVREFEEGAAQWKGLAMDLREHQRALRSVFAHLESVTAAVDSGEGTLGRLVNDPGLGQRAEQALDRLQGAMDTVEEVLENLRKASARLPGLADSLAGEVEDLPGAVLEVRTAIREAGKLIEGIQRHWLVRGYVDDEETGRRIPASRVMGAGGRSP